jgi:recombination protein RecT
MTMTETTATAPKPLHPLVMLHQRLEDRMGELKAALPSDVSPAQFIRAVMTSAQINPDILACSWQSLWTALLKACRDGLLPDGVEGAIVPYKSTASWIPMYQGQLRNFRRSGQFKWVTANVVREGEEFSHYVDETGEHFRHVPGDDFEAPIAKIYAMATTKDGGVFVAVMSVAEANKIRLMSKAAREDSPWKQWPRRDV